MCITSIQFTAQYVFLLYVISLRLISFILKCFAGFAGRNKNILILPLLHLSLLYLCLCLWIMMTMESNVPVAYIINHPEKIIIMVWLPCLHRVGLWGVKWKYLIYFIGLVSLHCFVDPNDPISQLKWHDIIDNDYNVISFLYCQVWQRNDCDFALWL